MTNILGDGTKHSWLVRKTDPNGNVVVANGTSSQVWFTDTLGIQALTSFGTPGQYDYLRSWSYPDISGSSTNTVTQSESFHTVQSNFGCPNTTGYGPFQTTLVDSITLADGSRYSFTYDTAGRIASMTLPTGGVITYTYTGSHGGISCIDGTIVSMTRQTPDGTWTYTRTQASPNGTTSVTDPSGNITAYSFSGPPGNTSPSFEINRQVYQGSSPLLSTTMTCYNGNSSNCGSNPPNGVSLPITQKTIYTTIGSKTSATTQYFDSYGNLTLQNENGFSDVGYPLLKQTTIVYAVNGSGACSNISANIHDRSCSVTVTNGAYKLAETLYSYNSAGNATQVRRLVSGATYLTESFGYDANGAVNSHTDVNGTAFTYTNGACNGAFPTITAGGGLSTSATWNCYGGVEASMADANGQPTTFSYNDPLWRLKSTTDPLSNVETMTYLTGAASYVNSSMPFNGSTSTTDITTFLDGLGRLKRVQQRKVPRWFDFRHQYEDV